MNVAIWYLSLYNKYQLCEWGGAVTEQARECERQSGVEQPAPPDASLVYGGVQYGGSPRCHFRYLVRFSIKPQLRATNRRYYDHLGGC